MKSVRQKIYILRCAFLFISITFLISVILHFMDIPQIYNVSFVFVMPFLMIMFLYIFPPKPEEKDVYLEDIKTIEYMDDKFCPQCKNRNALCSYVDKKENGEMIYDFLCSECYLFFQILINPIEEAERIKKKIQTESQKRIDACLDTLEKINERVENKDNSLSNFISIFRKKHSQN